MAPFEGDYRSSVTIATKHFDEPQWIDTPLVPEESAMD